MMKITEKKVKSATRKANEKDVVVVKEEVKELSNLDNAKKDIDRVIEFNNRNYLTKDEVIAILNSYIKD